MNLESLKVSKTRRWPVEAVWDNPIYRYCYQRMVNRKSYEATKCMREFYRHLICECQLSRNLWFDIGANNGDRATIFSELASKVVACEPDPITVLTLRRRFTFRNNVIVLEVAAGNQPGKVSMTVGGNAYSTISDKQKELILNNSRYANLEAKNFSTAEVTLTTLDLLVAEHGLPDYIKIDVEGYEVQVIAGLSSRVHVISFEANLPEFKEETDQCILRLASLSKEARFNWVSSDPPESFMSEAWLTTDKMSDVVNSGDHGYMEIFCRSK